VAAQLRATEPQHEHTHRSVNRLVRRGQPTPRRRQPRPVAYRRIAVCLSNSEASSKAVEAACTLAADQHARLTAIAAIEMPLELPLATADPNAEAAAREAVHKAHQIADKYGVATDGLILRARDPGEAIVAELTERSIQVVLIAAAWLQKAQRARLLGATIDHIMHHAPCRVMLIGHPAKRDAERDEPIFRAASPSDYWPTGTFIDRN
jgi:nucleotide-binding universal stress UspA family protein